MTTDDRSPEPEPSPGRAPLDDGAGDGGADPEISIDPEGSADGGGGADTDGAQIARTDGPEVTAAQALAMAERSAVHRVPRYGRFAFAGAVLALVLGAAATILFAEPGPNITLPQLYLIISVLTVPTFALLGCAVALLIERRARRRR